MRTLSPIKDMSRILRMAILNWMHGDSRFLVSWKQEVFLLILLVSYSGSSAVLDGESIYIVGLRLDLPLDKLDRLWLEVDNRLLLIDGFQL